MSTLSSKIQGLGVHLKVLPEEAYLTERLRELGRLREELESLQEVRKMMINDVIGAETLRIIDDIEIEMAPQEATINRKMEELREDMKPKIMAHEKTVKGLGFTASYVSGKEQVDLKKLREVQDKYPPIVQEIEDCIYMGKPQVRFVKNSQGR